MSDNHRTWTLRAAIAAIALAASLSGCATQAGSAQSSTTASARQDAQQLIGARWALIEIATARRSLRVPESLHATWQFTPDRRFLASDTVNAISGRYRASATGFAARDVGTTLAAYGGSDPLRLAIIAAFQKMTTRPVQVSLTPTPSTAVMRVPGYVMRFRRSGPATTASPAPPTSTANS